MAGLSGFAGYEALFNDSFNTHLCEILTCHFAGLLLFTIYLFLTQG